MAGTFGPIAAGESTPSGLPSSLKQARLACHASTQPSNKGATFRLRFAEIALDGIGWAGL